MRATNEGPPLSAVTSIGSALLVLALESWVVDVGSWEVEGAAEVVVRWTRGGGGLWEE